MRSAVSCPTPLSHPRHFLKILYDLSLISLSKALANKVHLPLKKTRAVLLTFTHTVDTFQFIVHIQSISSLYFVDSPHNLLLPMIKQIFFKQHE